MMIVLGIRRGEDVQKLAWVNDSGAGVYCSSIAGDLESHISYHRDGRTHVRTKPSKKAKLRAKGDVVTWFREQRPPLAEFVNQSQLAFQSFAIPGGQVIPPGRGLYHRWDGMVVVDEDQIAGCQSLGIDVRIFDPVLMAFVDASISETAAMFGFTRLPISHYHCLDAFPHVCIGIGFSVNPVA